LIPAIIPTEPASFPAAAPSSCRPPLPIFQSTLLAILGPASTSKSAAPAPNIDPAQPAKTPGKVTKPESLFKDEKERRSDEQKPAFVQETVPAVVPVRPLIVTMQSVQVESAVPAVKPVPLKASGCDRVIPQTEPSPHPAVPAALLPALDNLAAATAQSSGARHLQPNTTAAKPEFTPAGGCDRAIPRTEPSPPRPAVPAAPLPALDKLAAAATQSSGARQLQPNTTAAMPEFTPASYTEAGHCVREQFATAAPTAELDRSQPSTGAEIASTTAPAPLVGTHADVPVDTSSARPDNSQVPLQAVSQLVAQALPQALEVLLPPAVLNAPVVPVSPQVKATFDSATSGKISHNGAAGRLHPPAAGASSTDRPGRERSSRANISAETRSNTPTSEPAKGTDQEGSSEASSAKVQPEACGADTLQPQAPRPETACRPDANNSAPKANTQSPMPAHDPTLASAPLLAERLHEPLLSAQLIERVSQSELRLGMRTGEFGNIEIRTSLDHQQVKAEISSERGELGRALTAELPAFEQRMREQNVSLSTVVVRDASPGTGGDFDRSPRQQQPAPTPSNINTTSAPRNPGLIQSETWEPEGKLDIRI